MIFFLAMLTPSAVTAYSMIAPVPECFSCEAYKKSIFHPKKKKRTKSRNLIRVINNN